MPPRSVVRAGKISIRFRAGCIITGVRVKEQASGLRAILLLPLLAAGCGSREPAPGAQPSEAPATTLAPVATTTTTTTTTLPPPVWRTVRWGMSREEVLAALPGEARRLSTPENYGQPTPGATDIAIPDMTMGAIRYRALFGFGDGKLDRIHLVVPKAAYETCGDVERELTERHGKPAARGTIATSLRGESMTWNLPDHTLVLACTSKPSLGFHSVTIDRTPPGAPPAS